MSLSLQRNPWFLTAAAVLIFACGLLIWWLSQNLVQEQRYALRQASGKALYNPFYAAEQLLRQLDVEATSVRRLPKRSSMGPNDVLLMRTPSFTLSGREVDELLDWVDGGGQLLFAVYRYYQPGQSETDGSSDGTNVGPSDALLDFLAVTVEDFLDPFQSVVEVEVTAQVQPLVLSIRQQFVLRAEADYATTVIDADGKPLMLEFGFGEGRIAVISDMAFLNNRRIGEYDHSDFFWQWLTAWGPPEQVWLQYKPYVPGLFELLWRYAWPLLIGLLLTLAALLWASSQRLGPILLPPGGGQRSLIEHIRASGQFLWRQKQGHKLLAAAQQRVLQRVARKHTGWYQLNAAQQAAYIASWSDLTEQQINFALQPHSKLSRHEFMTIMQHLNQIGKKA